jgi:hypothetical protein
MFLQVALVVSFYFVLTCFGREISGEMVVGLFGFFSAEGIFLVQLKNLKYLHTKIDELRHKIDNQQREIDAQRRELDEQRTKIDTQRMDFLRQCIFNRTLSLAERCRFGAEYIECGGNDEAFIQDEINIENLRKKLEEKEKNR